MSNYDGNANRRSCWRKHGSRVEGIKTGRRRIERGIADMLVEVTE